MLTLVRSRYHFRRTVPVSIRKAMGQREIWISLDTSCRRTAKSLACMLQGETERVFSVARTGRLPEKFNLGAYLRKMMQNHPSDFETREEHLSANIKALAEFLPTGKESIVQRFISEVSERHAIMATTIANLTNEIDIAKKTGNQDREAELMSLLKQSLTVNQTLASRPAAAPVAPLTVISEPLAPPSTIQQPSKPVAEPRMRISSVIEKHLKDKKATAKDTQSYDKLCRVTRTSLRLFISCFGDMDVRKINGNVVGDFRDALSSLHVNHGRDRAGRSIQEEIDRTLVEGLEPISQKTIKNHLAVISPAWRDLVNREIVPRNPWIGWSFDTSQKVVRRAWTDAELKTLARSKWTTTVMSQKTYAAMVMIAAYSGMRIGEIAYLRNEDITELNGIPCFLIREHVKHGITTWKPKSKAGIRKVPIHSKLLAWGILDLMKPSEEYLLPELKGDESRSRGQSFSSEFSRHKTRIGLPLAVTFHGFRHTVSTRLRNVKADIREIWIDAMLGHEPSHKSMGTINYTTEIEIEHLRDVIELIEYQDDFIINI
ncbi:DUF6538 domain-containing protein [Komagataeibacter rhaeticus]|uniref:DUF6538 domain-containing protein n=1 Tax=Komagataeibacter rhaeticus TaxID=215221 RepID=UPI0002D9C373|nr:DUF6538 domain-containing protein [Komagataeibacter rhaeticus]WPP20732.1 tyrosine-type recombinase/integrase [Komagataeibacter rhaeticus]